MGAQKLLRGHDARASLRHPQMAPGTCRSTYMCIIKLVMVHFRSLHISFTHTGPQYKIMAISLSKTITEKH